MQIYISFLLSVLLLFSSFILPPQENEDEEEESDSSLYELNSVWKCTRKENNLNFLILLIFSCSPSKLSSLEKIYNNNAARKKGTVQKQRGAKVSTLSG